MILQNIRFNPTEFLHIEQVSYKTFPFRWKDNYAQFLPSFVFGSVNEIICVDAPKAVNLLYVSEFQPPRVINTICNHLQFIHYSSLHWLMYFVILLRILQIEVKVSNCASHIFRAA